MDIGPSGGYWRCNGVDLRMAVPRLRGRKNRLPQDNWDRRLLDDPRVLAACGLRDFLLLQALAAINGACMAAGFELLLGTDIGSPLQARRLRLPQLNVASCRSHSQEIAVEYRDGGWDEEAITTAWPDRLAIVQTH